MHLLFRNVRPLGLGKNACTHRTVEEQWKRLGTDHRVAARSGRKEGNDGVGETYEGVEVIDKRVGEVPERGGEVAGGPADGDGGGEHGPEREERDGRQGPHLVPPLPERRPRLAGPRRRVVRDGDLCRRGCRAVGGGEGLHSGGGRGVGGGGGGVAAMMSWFFFPVPFGFLRFL